jgi:hypothetical protein
MIKGRLTLALAFCTALLLGGKMALAHITPPVVLISDRDAILGMTGDATRFFVREVRLTPAERDRIQQQLRWQPEAETYRFYLGRSAAGQLKAAVIFLTEFTMHGPVRVAVGLSPDGKIRAAQVVELTEETFPWLKPLLDQNFTQVYVGQGNPRKPVARPNSSSMTQFYGQIVASLIQRATALFEVTVLQRSASG